MITDMSFQSNTLSWFWDNQSLHLFLNAAFLAEEQKTQFLVIDAIWSGLEPMIYCM
jgi:hypothetical protein